MKLTFQLVLKGEFPCTLGGVYASKDADLSSLRIDRTSQGKPAAPLKPIGKLLHGPSDCGRRGEWLVFKQLFSPPSKFN
jgi:hypothetical protein